MINILLLLVFSVLAVSADTLTGCPSCQGGSYSLTYESTGGNNYTITYAIETSGYNGGGVAINAVAVKPASAILSFSLISAPGGIGVWDTQGGQLNANGCSGSGSGWVCSQSTGLGVAVPTNNTLTWQWAITATSLFTNLDEASVKALFVDSSGGKVGATVSNHITMTSTDDPPGVPEPSTLAFGGIGALLCVTTAIKRRRSK
jgi:hypothetical protein